MSLRFLIFAIEVLAAPNLEFTGWQGPYSDRRSSQISRDPPPGCIVDQVSMLHRHGERWPEEHDAEKFIELVEILQAANLSESLQFVKHWRPYLQRGEGMIGQETDKGVYSGLFTAFKRGIDYRERYGGLWDVEEQIPIFSAGFQRVIATARKFGQGFAGYNYTTGSIALNIIPETDDQGANSLMLMCQNTQWPTTTCLGSTKTEIPREAQWVYPEFFIASSRLNAENPGLELEPKQVPQLMSLGAFELNVRGSSPWIDVFTSSEWAAFEYLQSSHFYCYFGPGSPIATMKGWVYLNATRALLTQGPNHSKLPIAWSFTHDTEISGVVAALQFASLPDGQAWDPTTPHEGMPYDVSQIVPQGGHITFERLVCDPCANTEMYNAHPFAFTRPDIEPQYLRGHSYATRLAQDSQFSEKENIFVRLIVNEAVVPLPQCQDGPGLSCPLSAFDEFVTKTDSNYGDMCNVPEGYPRNIDFFWHWNTSTDLISEPAYLPFRGKFTDYLGNPIDI